MQAELQRQRRAGRCGIWRAPTCKHCCSGRTPSYQGCPGCWWKLLLIPGGCCWTVGTLDTPESYVGSPQSGSQIGQGHTRHATLSCIHLPASMHPCSLQRLQLAAYCQAPVEHRRSSMPAWLGHTSPGYGTEFLEDFLDARKSWRESEAGT